MRMVMGEKVKQCELYKCMRDKKIMSEWQERKIKVKAEKKKISE